jgi:NAD(P)H-hydrate epimerase
MDRIYFQTDEGIRIPAVTEAEMREVDRLAVEEYQLGILQMMENAGRNLSLLVMDQSDDVARQISILAGSGGNGGGGLCCARHLHNRGYDVKIFLSKPTTSLRGAARAQMTILESAGVLISALSNAEGALATSQLIIDALIGYSLSGPPTGETEQLIHLANSSSAPILSLDLPSGVDATNGTTPGVSVEASSTLTLALPKTGLQAYTGSLHVADIGIPPELYQSLGFEPPPFPSGKFILPIHAA